MICPHCLDNEKEGTKVVLDNDGVVKIIDNSIDKECNYISIYEAIDINSNILRRVENCPVEIIFFKEAE